MTIEHRHTYRLIHTHNQLRLILILWQHLDCWLLEEYFHAKIDKENRDDLLLKSRTYVAPAHGTNEFTSTFIFFRSFITRRCRRTCDCCCCCCCCCCCRWRWCCWCHRRFTRCIGLIIEFIIQQRSRNFTLI